jgi:hypothetical protein
MILAVLALAMSDPPQFSTRMNEYLACLSSGMPVDIGKHDLATRSQIYRHAAAQCQGQRDAAIAAAVRNRRPDQSAAEARALAIDIIDTLDPMSSRKTH